MNCRLPNQKAEMRIEPKGNDAPAQDEAPAYTQNTPVEELLQVMTLEQARQVVVDDGICRGMTIAQVAEKRRSICAFISFRAKARTIWCALPPSWCSILSRRLADMNPSEGTKGGMTDGLHTRMNFRSISWMSWNCCACVSGASSQIVSMWIARSR